jgi:hypothetical protein
MFQQLDLSSDGDDSWRTTVVWVEWRHVVGKKSDLLEEHFASIFRSEV